MTVKRIGEEIVSAIASVGMYAIEVDADTVVPIVSLSPGKLGEIQAGLSATFNDIVFHPMTRMDVLEAVVLAAFDKAKKKRPRTQFKDARDLLPYLVEMPSTLPLPDFSAEEPADDGELDPTPAS